MELRDTISMMSSANYKERFKAEFYALKIRRDKLVEMIAKWDKEELSFIPTCPKKIYYHQLSAMDAYLGVLLERAELEGIFL